MWLKSLFSYRRGPITQRSSIILLTLMFASSVRAQEPSQIVVPVSAYLMELEQISQLATDENVAGLKINVDPCNEQNAGKWTNEGTYQVWTLDIAAEGGYGVLVYFDELVLPEGSDIRAYDVSKTQSSGPFFSNPNRSVKSFALPPISGDQITIEARIPSSSIAQFKAKVSEIGCIVPGRDKGFGETDPCFVNVNCPEGAPWSDQKRSVIKYTYTEGSFIGNCTGALLNNTAEDKRNLFLTAHHCAQGATDEELGQVIFFFNYESPGCETPVNDFDLDDEIVIGCIRLAASGQVGSPPPGGSDFHLFEINPIDSSYNVFYAGWNRNYVDDLSGPGSVIQHPLADIKKISYVSHFELSGTSGSDLYAVLETFPSGTGGTVEPNASGSPIFDAQHLVVGTVSYGSQGCIDEDDIAGGGMVWAHWDQNGLEPERQLAPWLDPLQTGALALDGRNGATASAVGVGPSRLVLRQNYPNPFNPSTSIEFELAETTHVTLRIYDMRGTTVRTLVNDRLSGSLHSIAWNGRDDFGNEVGSGVYCYRLEVGTSSISRKLVMIR